MGLIDKLKGIKEKVKIWLVGEEPPYFKLNMNAYGYFLKDEKRFPCPGLMELGDYVSNTCDLSEEKCVSLWNSIYRDYMKKYGAVPKLMELLEEGNGFELKLDLMNDERFCRIAKLNSYEEKSEQYAKLRAGAALYYFSFH